MWANLHFKREREIKKTQAGSKLSNILPKSSHTRKKPPYFFVNKKHQQQQQQKEEEEIQQRKKKKMIHNKLLTNKELQATQPHLVS